MTSSSESTNQTTGHPSTDVHSIIQTQEPLGDFQDTEGGAGVGVTNSNPFTHGVDPDFTLNKFLERPVIIGTTTWSSTAFAQYTNHAMYSLLTNAKVAKKIGGYANIRGNLRIRVTYNGTPLQFGALMVSWAPGPAGDNTGRSGVPAAPTLIRCSQLRNGIITGSSASNVELTIPFLWPRPFLSISLPALNGSTDDAWNYGRLNITQICPLSSANNEVVVAGTLQIFAWLEDCVLQTPTFVAAAGEAVKPGGLVSKVASTVGRVAEALSGVPFIGATAGTVATVAGAVGAVARAFGFSRPLNMEEQRQITTRCIGNLSLCDGVDSIQKLSVHADQGVDQGRLYDGTEPQADEMSIASIASRESGFDTATAWNTTDAANTIILAYNVNPVATIQRPAANTAEMTPLGFAALPFRYWTGTIIYRLRVICSPLMRGRLLIFHYPHNGTGYTTLTATDVCNTMPHCILDVSAETDVEFHVHPAMRSLWMVTGAIGDTYAAGSPEYANGTLVIMVLNELVAPAASSAYIWPTVRGGPDFQVAVPTISKLNGLYFTAAAGDSIPGVLGTGQNGPRVCHLGAATPIPDLERTYFGEAVRSFRALVKRYSYYTSIHCTIPLDTAETLWSMENVIPFYPPPPATGQPAGWPVTQYTWLSWVAQGFLMQRGGVRVKADIFDRNNYTYSAGGAPTWRSMLTRILTDTAGIAAYATKAVTWTGFVTLTYGYEGDGSAITHESCPFLEAEVPYYNLQAWCIPGDWQNNSGINAGHPYSLAFLYQARLASTTDWAKVSSFHLAGADDYLCREWVGVGRLQYGLNVRALLPTGAVSTLT